MVAGVTTMVAGAVVVVAGLLLLLLLLLFVVVACLVVVVVGDGVCLLGRSSLSSGSSVTVSPSLSRLLFSTCTVSIGLFLGAGVIVMGTGALIGSGCCSCCGCC